MFLMSLMGDRDRLRATLVSSPRFLSLSLSLSFLSFCTRMEGLRLNDLLVGGEGGLTVDNEKEVEGDVFVPVEWAEWVDWEDIGDELFGVDELRSMSRDVRGVFWADLAEGGGCAREFPSEFASGFIL